jgi:hypothetical protein
MPDPAPTVPREVLEEIAEFDATYVDGHGNVSRQDLARHALALRECLEKIVVDHDPWEKGGSIDQYVAQARALLGED